MVLSTLTGQVDPRSYNVRTTDAREYRRNRRDLIKAREDILPYFEPPVILSRDHESEVLGPYLAIPLINSDNLSIHVGEPKSKTSDSVPASLLNLNLM